MTPEEIRQAAITRLVTTRLMRAIKGIAAGLILLAATRAQAYSLEGVKWGNGNASFYLDLGQYNNVAATELAQWDQYTGNTHLRTTHNSTTNGSGNFFMDGLSSIVFSDSIGYDLASNVLGVCSPNAMGNNGILTEADIIINSDFDWAYWDIGEVLLHELGHAIGLGHSSFTNAVMSPYYTGQLAELTADDIAGAQFIYGPRTTQNVPDTGSTAGLLGFVLGLLAIAKRRKQTPSWIYEQ